MITLKQLADDKINELGLEGSAEYFGVTVQTIKVWMKKAPSFPAAERLFQEFLANQNPAGIKSSIAEIGLPEVPFSSVKPDDGEKELLPVPERPEDRKVAILFPTNRDVNPYVMQSIMSIFDKRKMRWEMKKDALAVRARNELVKRFLETGAEWSVWIDSDILVPNGNPAWFKKLTGSRVADKHLTQNAIERIINRGKTVVGGVYCERKENGKLVIQPDFQPNKTHHAELVAKLKRGPVDLLEPVEWIATGFLAVHRSVYEDIKKTFPELAPQGPNGLWGFFDQMKDKGEDVSFSLRCKDAGHQPFLDCSIMLGHVGSYVFTPDKITERGI